MLVDRYVGLNICFHKTPSTMLRLCIVEDQNEIRTQLVAAFDHDFEFECLAAYPSGEAAVEGISKLRPDVVVMDLGLPGISGIEAMSRLQDAGCAADFLIFSVFDHDEMVFGALQVGACGYINKREGPDGVVKAVREYAAGGAPMSRAIARRVLERFKVSASAKTHAFAELTDHQTNILRMVAEGLLNKEIADRLGVTVETIKQHNVKIYRKLSVNNRAEAVRYYLNNTH